MTFANPYTLRVLQWVSFAARPLHIDELREAVAFDLDDLEWDAGKIPQADVVIGCGANLVAIDPSDQCVRFAHPSVRAYLQKTSARSIPGYPKSDEHGVLQCGELCVAYLSFSNFNLGLVKVAETEVLKVPDPKLLAGDALASPIFRFFWARGASPEQSISAKVHFRRIRSATVPDRSQYKFLDYAVTQWTFQTKKITSISSVWDKFKQLSFSFNETWNFHPWVVGGRSQISRLHGLFGWAVKEAHIPLLELTLAWGPEIREVCNIPLVDERLPALHVASKMGLADVVNLLLPVCDLNLQDEEGYTALHHAVIKSAGVAEILLRPGLLKVDIPSKTQVTPLWLAATHGNRILVGVLTGRKANIEARERSTLRTPLLKAAQNGHLGVVDLLLDKGASLEAQDAGGRTPLAWAIENDHLSTVELLLERGASPVLKFSNKEKLLLLAAQTRRSLATALLAKNTEMDLNATDDDGLTALWLAVLNHHQDIAKILLDCNANRECRDADGQTPLLWAVRNRHEVLIELLLNEGAAISAQDEEERTALFWAVKHGDEVLVKLLLEWIGNQPEEEKLLQFVASQPVRTGTEMVGFLGESGVTEDQMPLLSALNKSVELLGQRHMERKLPLNQEGLLKQATSMWSTRFGQRDLLMMLSGKSADNVEKDRALLEAAKQGNVLSARLQVNEGADIHMTTSYGETPLWWAARNGHAAVVEFLHERGGNIESKDKFGLTPLAWAVENRHELVIRLLVGWGANIRASDKSGQTPLSRANRKGTRSLLPT